METPAKKKILFLITKSNWGGAQRYVFDLATNLPTDYEAVVALGGSGALTEKLHQAGVRTIPLPHLQRDVSLGKEIKSFRDIYHIVKAERPDVLHVNSSKAGGIGALCGRLLSVPRIMYTAHGWAFNEDRGVIAKGVVGFLHWLTIMLAHETITVSDGLKRQMKWPFTQNKMTTIRLGRDLKRQTQQQSERRASLAAESRVSLPSPNDFWFCTIGELHPIKRQSAAIAALAKVIKTHPTARYLLIGDGSERAQLEQQVADLNLREHVFFLGHMHEASRHLGACDVFLVPSKSEAAVYVILEAGQTGLPVIATNVGGIPEWIESKTSGVLVPPDDVSALAAAMNDLIEQPHLRTQYADALHEHTRHFTTSRMVAETIAHYHPQSGRHYSLRE